LPGSSFSADSCWRGPVGGLLPASGEGWDKLLERLNEARLHRRHAPYSDPL
jgi:hypothetical protein